MPDLMQLLTDLGNMAATVASADDKIKLAEAATTLNVLATENKKLMDNIDDLKTQLARRKALEYRKGAYYVMANDVSDGPICPKCYQETGLIYRLATISYGARCPVCGAVYEGIKGAVQGRKQQIL